MSSSVYTTINHMASSISLQNRVAACAAQIGNEQPRSWAANCILTLVATAPASLTTAWLDAELDLNGNPDVGARNDVVTDAIILSAVNGLRAVQGPGNNGWPVA